MNPLCETSEFRIGLDEPRPSIGWCLFHLEAKPWAVPLSIVSEIVSVEKLVPLPIATPGILGLFPHRRDIIPVLNPNDRENEPHPHHPNDWSRGRLIILVLKTPKGLLGLSIDSSGATISQVPCELDEANNSNHDQYSPTRPNAVQHRQSAHAIFNAEELWSRSRRLIEQAYGR